MMVMPLPGRSASRSPGRGAPPASPRMNGAQTSVSPAVSTSSAAPYGSGAKSPIKKHLKNAATTKWPTPATSILSSSYSAATRDHAGRRPIVMGAMRASVIQVMLGLLDQDQETVEGTVPILEALAALPLENPTTRRECLRMLQSLEQSCFSPSKPSPSRARHDLRFDAASDVPTSEGDNDRLSTTTAAGIAAADDDDDAVPPSFVSEFDDHLEPRGSLSLWSLSSVSSASSSSSSSAYSVPRSGGTNSHRSEMRVRDSGRAKSVSLHHCKEFLLACANEIHELDSENPKFDYAEETGSETSRRGQGASRAASLVEPRALSTRGRTSWRAAEFDYASTASGSSSPSVATGLDHDDVEADQGSEFSEVLRRADYLSDFGDADSDNEHEDDDEDGDGEEGDDNESSLSGSSDDSVHAALRDKSPRGEQQQTKKQQRLNQQQAIRELDDVRSRVLCRQVLRRLHAAATDSALQRRVFAALKRHGYQRARQRSAFERIKAHAQQMRLKRLTMKKLRVATWRRGGNSGATKTATAAATPAAATKASASGTGGGVGGGNASGSAAATLRAKMLLAQHLDLVFVALCGAFLHAAASGGV